MHVFPSRRRTLNLALQGGGAHGAFTWGVLDALLEDGRLDFGGVSGASAGAMNAVCLAEGLRRGGPDGAREQLRRFWLAVSASAPFAGVPLVGPFDTLMPLALQAWMRLTEAIGPQQFNPLNINPLRSILAEQVDFEALRANCPLPLFISTTQVRTGKLHLLRAPQLTLDGVLASACLPTLHHAVQLEGEAYWDGGYSANPPVLPLCLDGRGGDTLLVLLDVQSHATDTASPQSVRERLQGLAFSSAFLAEMRTIAELQRRMPPTWLPGFGVAHRLGRARFHLVHDEARFAALPATTRMQADAGFFALLFEAGRAQATAWLAEHFGAIGRRSTLDLAGHFL